MATVRRWYHYLVCLVTLQLVAWTTIALRCRALAAYFTSFGPGTMGDLYYPHIHCQLAEANRIFRLDRIHDYRSGSNRQ
jgi:hypothetical protein